MSFVNKNVLRVFLLCIHISLIQLLIAAFIIKTHTGMTNIDMFLSCNVLQTKKNSLIQISKLTMN